MPDTELLAAYHALIADVYELAGRSRRTSDDFARQRGETAARWHVMSVVREVPLPVPRMADRLGVTRQSVQAVVDTLVDDGLVELVPNPAHQRSRLVQLRPDGRDTLDSLFAGSADARTAMLERAGVTVAELDAAAVTLRRLLHHYGPI